MNPKLIQAHAEIEAILVKHDIAGHVILHTAPGDIEIVIRLDPSYSRLQEVGDGPGMVSYRFSATSEQYRGDADAQWRDVAATANMVDSMAQILSRSALAMLDLAQRINVAAGAHHTGLYPTHGTAH